MAAKRFHSVAESFKGDVYNVEIWDTSFSGTSTPFETAAGSFGIEIMGRGGAWYQPIQPTECSFTLLVQNTTHEELLADLLVSGEDRFSVKVTDGSGNMKWVGMILPDIGSYDEAYYPYGFSIRATDGLGTLKNVDFKDSSSAYSGKERLIEHICKALNKLPYVAVHFGSGDTLVRSAIDFWEENMLHSSLSSDALHQTYLDHAVWYVWKKDVQEYQSAYKVLEDIVKPFYARITMNDGRFWIESWPYRTAATIVTRLYNKSGGFISAENYAGANTIDQTASGALEATGVYEYFPALKKATHTFKGAAKRNFLSGISELNETNLTSQIVRKPIHANDGSTSLRLSGNLSVRIKSNFPDPDANYMNVLEQFCGTFILSITLGTTQFLKRTYSFGTGYQINYDPAEWHTPAGAYIVVPFGGNGAFIANNSADWYTFNLPFSILTPPITENADNFSVLMYHEAYKKYDGTSYSLSDFTMTFRVKDLWLEAYSYGHPALSTDETIFECQNTVASGTSDAHEQESLAGTATDPNNVGAFWVKPAADYILCNNWGIGTAMPNKRLEYHLVEHLVNGRRYPLRKISGTMFGSLTALKRLVWQEQDWILLGGMEMLAENRINATWVRLDYGGTLSASPPKLVIKIDEPVPAVPLELSSDIGNAGYNANATPPPALMYPVSQALTGAAVIPGAITSIPVDGTLADNDFNVNDQLLLFHPLTGHFTTFTVNATTADGETSISVASVTTTELYPKGSYLIKKPLIGTPGQALPPGADGQILRYDNGWKAYGDTSMSDGDVLTWSDALGFHMAAPSGTGTVTSVGLSMPSIFTVSGSPVTSSGTLTASLNQQVANVVFAGPVSGGTNVPSFRSLVAADIPALPYLTANQTITLSGDVSGSGATAITTTIGANIVTDAKFRQSAGLSVVGRSTNTTGNVADITAGTDGHVFRRSGISIGFGALDLSTAASTTGALPANKGGTGLSAFVVGQLFYANTTSTIAALGIGTAGQFLGITGGLPAWQSPTTVTGSGVAQQVALWGSTSAITGDTDLTFDGTNLKIGAGTGSGYLSVLAGAITPDTDFYYASANVTGIMSASIVNSHNAGNTGSSMLKLEVGGASGGDPFIKFIIGGGNATLSIGHDNSDVDKFKITPTASAPGGVANCGIIITNQTTPAVGINLDTPVYPLDVNGKNRSVQYFNTQASWGSGSFSFGTGAGTTPVFGSSSGGANAFQVTFTTGTAPVANAVIFTVTYPVSFPGTLTYITFSPRNAAAAIEISKFYAITGSGSGFTFQAAGTLTATTTYAFQFYIGSYV